MRRAARVAGESTTTKNDLNRERAAVLHCHDHQGGGGVLLIQSYESYPWVSYGCLAPTSTRTRRQLRQFISPAQRHHAFSRGRFLHYHQKACTSQKAMPRNVTMTDAQPVQTSLVSSMLSSPLQGAASASLTLAAAEQYSKPAAAVEPLVVAEVWDWLSRARSTVDDWFHCHLCCRDLASTSFRRQ